MVCLPPRCMPTDTLFPYTTLVRSQHAFGRPVDLRLQLRVPPNVINVNSHAEMAVGRATAQRIADVERLAQRVHAGAIGSIHRMQRFEDRKSTSLNSSH